MATKQDTKNKKKLEKQRLEAAEKVCWTLMLMIGVGLLDIPVDERRLLAQSMDKWVDLAVETGILDE